MTEQKLQEALRLSDDIRYLKRDIEQVNTKFRLYGNGCTGITPESYKDIEDSIRTFAATRLTQRLKELELKFKKL